MQQNTAASHVLPVVKQLLTLEREKYPDMEAILFGSYAYGDPGKESDIDVALLLDQPLDLDMELEIFSDALQVNSRLEVHLFNKTEFAKARRAMVYDIKEKGIKIV